MNLKKIRICRVLIIIFTFLGWIDLYNGPIQSANSEVVLNVTMNCILMRTLNYNNRPIGPIASLNDITSKF